MKLGLYSFVGLYSQGLETLAHLLRKGVAHANAIGASEAEMLGWRLAEDMFPLRRQAQIVCTFAKQWPARAAGLAVPPAVEGESSVSDLLEAIAAAKAYLQDLKPEQFEGRDGIPLTHAIGEHKPSLPIGQWVGGFATTNFYFHLSMAYAILRMKGAPLGKRDFFTGGGPRRAARSSVAARTRQGGKDGRGSGSKPADQRRPADRRKGRGAR